MFWQCAKGMFGQLPLTKSSAVVGLSITDAHGCFSVSERFMKTPS